MWVWNSVKSALGYEIENLEVEETGKAEAHDVSSNPEERKSLFSSLSGFIGKDISSLISLPIWIFEPLSFLQIMCEPMQYSDLLLRAADEKDPSLRLALVTAFVSGGYSCAVRNKKPFNPILGETFQYIPENQKWRFFAEQVSHHPPIGASFVETLEPGFELSLNMALKTKFRGNSSDVMVEGHNYIKFHKFGDHITWGHLNSCAHNVIIGGMWIDHYGTLEMENHSKGGYKMKTEFTQCGFLSAGRWQVNGTVTDPQGKVTLTLTGLWNEYLKVIWPDKREEVIWKKGDPPVDEWGFTKFNQSLNVIPKDQQLPETDSRYRSDRLALEKGQTEFAGTEKHRLEEKQRTERKAREEKKQTWVPKYFKYENDRWVYDGYWDKVNNNNNTKEQKQ